MQEERQRGKDRNENEVESTSSANEDMPVEKILEAELAVEPKTETYIEANMGLTPSSVRNLCPSPLGTAGGGCGDSRGCDDSGSLFSAEVSVNTRRFFEFRLGCFVVSYLFTDSGAMSSN